MRIFYGLLLSFSAAYANPSWAACINVPRTETNTAVKVCESLDSYTYHIAGNIYEYEKTTYRDAFASLLNDWFAHENLPPQSARVTFWTAVPEANPEAAQARAVMQVGSRRFVFFLPIHPADWSLANIRVSILGKNEAYPEFYGHTAGSLLVKKSETVQEVDLENFLANYQAYNPVSYAPGWSSYSVPIFKEQSIKEAIVRDDPSGRYVAKTELNHVFEWIALRERVFAFSIYSP
jgi:hypothetical protein